MGNFECVLLAQRLIKWPRFLLSFKFNILFYALGLGLEAILNGAYSLASNMLNE
jgi:hypothetical protein